MSKTVLVTGGAGYVGSHACKALAISGYTPVVYDNLSRGFEWAAKWGPLEIGDVRDFDRLASVISDYDPVGVMHFASFCYVGESAARPDLYYENNVVGALTLLRCMSALEIDTLVWSSSCTVYGSPEVVPILEDHPKNPVSPYGASKYMVEQRI